MEEGKALLRKSVKIACEERDNFWVEYQQKVHAGTAEPGQYQRALVAASIGSYGAYLADGSEYRCVSFAPELDAVLILFFFMDVLVRHMAFLSVGKDFSFYSSLKNKFSKIEVLITCINAQSMVSGKIVIS